MHSRERSLSWKMGKRSEDGKGSTVPRKSNQPATTPFPKLRGASCFNGMLLVGWEAGIPGAEVSSWAWPPGPSKCPPHSGLCQAHPDEAFGPKNPHMAPARDVDIGKEWMTWGLPGPLYSSLSLYSLTIPSGSSPWRPLPSNLPTSSAQTSGPHKADQQSGPAVHRTPAVSPAPPATSPRGGDKELFR